jgi:hypothetical protein
MTEREKQIICLQLKTGSCAGCDILPIAERKFRWTPMSPEQAAREVSKEYCPNNARMQVQHLVNHDASHSFGMRREENTDFDGYRKKW